MAFASGSKGFDFSFNSALLTSDFNYDLPEEFIAQHPVEPRDSARLLVLTRETKQIEHTVFK